MSDNPLSLFISREAPLEFPIAWANRYYLEPSLDDLHMLFVDANDDDAYCGSSEAARRIAQEAEIIGKR